MSSRSYGPPFGDEDSWDQDTTPTTKQAAKPSWLDDSWLLSHYTYNAYGDSIKRIPWREQKPSQKLTVIRRRLALAAGAYLVSVLMFGFVAQMAVASEIRDFRVADYLKAAGVGQGQTMPLDLGGSSAQTNGSGFMFLGIADARLDGKATTTRVITLGVVFHQTHYIMDVPLTQVQFITKEGVKPSGSFTVRNNVLDTMDVKYRCNPIWAYGLCHEIPGTPDIKNSKVSKRAPGPMLQKNLDMLTLTVTPDQYRGYLNNGQPTRQR